MPSQPQQPDENQMPKRSEGERRATPPGLVDSGMLLARTTQLACEGALNLLLHSSVRRVWHGLVDAGLEWEQEYMRRPEDQGRRRAERE